MLSKLPVDIYNYCSKYISRNFQLGRPFAEPWRFPLVKPYFQTDESDSSLFNEVTFIYFSNPPDINEVKIVGNFSSLRQAIPLARVEDSPFYYTCQKLPKGLIYKYKFIVDGNIQLDPVNTLQCTDETGEVWSFCVTDYCTVPITFEKWELPIIERLANHILPFRTEDGRRFLDYYYFHLDNVSKDLKLPRAYRLDQSVGVVNYIDKLLAKEESHHRVGYKICLKIIRSISRQFYPNQQPAEVSMSFYTNLYQQMATGNVIGWDYGKYNDPRHFLTMLRRHVFTGAFAHPRYGGNAHAAGWQFLAERYADETGSLFKWQLAFEKPLGTNNDYLG